MAITNKFIFFDKYEEIDYFGNACGALFYDMFCARWVERYNQNYHGARSYAN